MTTNYVLADLRQQMDNANKTLKSAVQSALRKGLPPSSYSKEKATATAAYKAYWAAYDASKATNS